MRYPKLRELKEAIISLFTFPFTTKFPKKPHVPFEKFRGKPVVDEDNCVGCETCANVCPTGAISFKDDAGKKVRTITRDYSLCIFCGQCEANCITGKGVKLSNKIFDLATFDKKTLVELQKRDLLTCENCNAIITTKDHLKYIHNKLGAKAFASVLNLKMLNERLNLAESKDVSFETKDGLKRKDVFNVICPNCLRKVAVKYLQ